MQQSWVNVFACNKNGKSTEEGNGVDPVTAKAVGSTVRQHLPFNFVLAIATSIHMSATEDTNYSV